LSRRSPPEAAAEFKYWIGTPRARSFAYTRPASRIASPIFRMSVIWDPMWKWSMIIASSTPGLRDLDRLEHLASSGRTSRLASGLGPLPDPRA
jgi:hypothetical protein